MKSRGVIKFICFVVGTVPFLGVSALSEPENATKAAQKGILEVTERYEGKPFLRLLDAYVLDSIADLDSQSAHSLALMEPKLRETYQTQGSWQDIVAEQMQFPEDMPRQIKEIWNDAETKARNSGMELSPVEFTHHFVDTNFQ